MNRVKKILNRQPVDKIPVQVNYTNKMGSLLSEYWNIPFEELDKIFNNHFFRVNLTYEKRIDKDKKIDYDWWGAGFDMNEEGYLVCDYPLKGVDNADNFKWPDPEAPGLMENAKKAIEKERNVLNRFIAPNFGFALFERAWSLCGLQEFMMDMYTAPELAETILEKITEINIVLAKRFVGLGVDGGYFGDDLGAQKSMLFSPDKWKEIFKPRMKRMFSCFTDAGLPVIMHSDGDIKPIIPDLIEIGLSCLNPIQPEILDHKWLKKEYGKDLSFYGGVSTQDVLPHGTKAEVIEAGKNCLKDLASDGTGLLYGPSHRIISDIPMENIDAFLETYNNL